MELVAAVIPLKAVAAELEATIVTVLLPKVQVRFVLQLIEVGAPRDVP